MHPSVLLSMLVVWSFVLDTTLSSTYSGSDQDEMKNERPEQQLRNDAYTQASGYSKGVPNSSQNIFIPLLISRNFISSHIQGYCFRRLSLPPGEISTHCTAPHKPRVVSDWVPFRDTALSADTNFFLIL